MSTTPIMRRSASQVATPPTTIPSQTSRRAPGRNSHMNSTASATVQPASDVSLLNNLQAKLEKLNSLLKDLQIKCTYNSTAIAFLKQENKRLSDTIQNQQFGTISTRTSSLSSTNQLSSAASSSRELSKNNFSIKNNTNITNTHIKTNSINENNLHSNSIINNNNTDLIYGRSR